MAGLRVKIKGGEGVRAMFARIGDQLSNPASLRVGFLENAKYPDGTPVAMIAAINEFGAPSRGQPPRPFFRNMIREKQGEWPAAIKGLIVSNDYNMAKAMDQAGAAIAGQLRQSILDLMEPPLAPSTIRRKGFDKPLIDSRYMWKRVDHEVKTP
jgi:hypothetical protein